MIPPHRFGHGPPPTAGELAAFEAIVADLTGKPTRSPHREPVASTRARGLRGLYAWLRTDESGPSPAAVDSRDGRP